MKRLGIGLLALAALVALVLAGLHRGRADSPALERTRVEERTGRARSESPVLARPELPESAREELDEGPEPKAGGRDRPELVTGAHADTSGRPEPEDLARGARRVPFVVHDTGARPIAGAIGYAGEFSLPTDREGRGVIESVDLEATTLMVAARDRAVGFAEIPPVIDAPLRVVLDAATQLEIHVVTPPDLGRENLRVVVETQGPLLPRGDYRSLDLLKLFGAATFESAMGAGDGAPGWMAFLLGKGPVLVPDLRPQRITVRVTDLMRVSLHEEPPFEVAAGEHRRVDITLASGVRDVSGQVVDVDWFPVAGAKVMAEPESGAGLRVTTDAEGRFTLGAVAAHQLEFTVSRAGYVSFDALLDLPADGALEAFRLPRALEVRVELRDPEAALVTAESVTAVAAGWFIPKATPVRDGSYRQSGLPPGIVLLQATVGGRTYEQLHDSSDPEAVLRVPKHGSVRCEFRRPPGNDDRYAVTLRGPGNMRLRQVIPDGELAETLFPAVLPGRYTASLIRSPRSGRGDQEWNVPGTDVPVTVVAGMETRTTL